MNRLNNTVFRGASVTLGVAGALALAGLTLLLLPSSSSAALEDAKGAAFAPVAPLDALMEVMEGNVFSKIPEQLKAGKFKDIKREGYFLAEVANVTAFAKDFRDKKEYRDFAEAMKAASLKLAEAAEKKDEAGVKAQHAAVEKTCESCHEKFRDN